MSVIAAPIAVAANAPVDANLKNRTLGHALRSAALVGATPLLLAIGAMSLGGCASEPPPFDPRAAQRSERESAGDDVQQPMRPLPTTLESTYLQRNRGNGSTRPVNPPSTGPSLNADRVTRMPLQELIHRGVANSMDVKVAGYAPAIESTRAIEAEARFDPTYFANVNLERRNNQQAYNTVTAGTSNVERGNIITSATGLRQNLESGGQIELRYDQSYNRFKDVPTINPNPYVENHLVLEITQPLLQNLGSDVNRARITIARNNTRISVLDFRKQVEQTTSDIERTYWQMVQAERDVRINEKLLSETMGTANVLINRLGQDVTRVQISQANASVEQRRATLIRAKAKREDLSDQMKRLMNDPDYPVTGGVVIMPADGPLEDPVHFDLKDEIDTAMKNRFELGQQQIRIDSSDVALRFAKNQELPTLNLKGSVGYQGLDNDYDNAFNDMLQFDHLDYQVGLQLEIPIGNRQARAQTRRAMLQRWQAMDQYRLQVDQIALDVKTALREVQTTWNEMAATRQARFAAADSLSAVEQREAGGEPLTPTFVQLKLQQQEQLADAARRENEAVANYNIAISRLEFFKGTLLKYNNVVMEEEQLAQMDK